MRSFYGVPSDVPFDGQRQATRVILDGPSGRKTEIGNMQREYDQEG